MPKSSGLVMGFDFGLRYIGLAIGQLVTKTARPLLSLKAVQGQPDWSRLKQILDEWRPYQLVLGMPLDSSLDEKLLQEKVQQFARRLTGRFNLPVAFVFENHTTVEAKSILRGTKTQAQFDELNALAATIILTEWLENQSLSEH